MKFYIVSWQAKHKESHWATDGWLNDGNDFFLLQARNRSSVNSRAATGGSQTVQTGRSIHTFTHRTSHTTAGFRGATRATHIPVLCGSTWKCTAVGPVLPAKVLPLVTTVTEATPTALQQRPSASRRQVAGLQAQAPPPQISTTITTTITTPATLHQAIRPRPSTNNTTPWAPQYPTNNLPPGLPTYLSGMCVKVPQECQHRQVTNIRPLTI